MNLGSIGGALVLASVACSLPASLEGKAEKPMRESREETVARCLRDVKSPDVAVRRRASLLLGKYPSLQTDLALIDCLQDEDAEIRLGALISLTEERLLPPVAKMAVFRLLKDPDVHVRRQASSLLGDALGVTLRGSVRLQGNVHVQTGRMPQTGSAEWNEMRELMLRGLEDEDSSVRKNVLMACKIFDVQAPADCLQGFLQDADAEVRLQALQMLSRSVRDVKEMFGLVAPFAKDPAAPIRMAVCNLCPYFGRDGEILLRDMLQDQSGEVRVCAAMNLSRLRVKDSLAVLRGVLFDENIPGTLRRSLVYEISMYPAKEARSLYRELLDSSSAEMAEQGMLMLNRLNSGIETADFFIPYLDSDKGQVGKLALSGMLCRTKTLTPKNMVDILSLRNRAAREFVLRQGVLMLDSAGRSEVLMEACMDDDVTIRVQALRQIGRYRPDGWEEILMASLEDNEPSICLAAADGLCRWPSKASQQALKAYLPSCKDKLLQGRIEAALKRRVLR